MGNHNTFNGVWQRASEQLSKILSKDIHARWITVIRPISLEAGVLTLGVANDFYVIWLTENYLPLIRQTVAEATGRELDIMLRVVPEADGAREALPAPTAPPPVPHKKPSSRPTPVLGSAFTFDAFIVGPSNSFSHAACLAVAQKPAQAYNPLLIYGGSGLGKTHLMQAIGHQVFQSSKTARVCYLSAESFLNEYIDALQTKSPLGFRRKYRGIDLLLLDDVHFLAGKTGIQEEFFHTFNALFGNRKQIVLTCDRPVSQIQGLEPRLVSRFTYGLVTELSPPDLETRIAILRKKASVMNIALSNDVMQFIAENIRSDMRKLEGALTRAVSYASLLRQPLTVETVRTLLRDTIERPAAAPTADLIQRAVAEAFDLRLSDMTSKRRPAAVATPRQIAMYLCRSLTNRSLPAIGESFGRNHATVIHACRTVDERMKRDPMFRETVENIREKLTAARG